MPDNPLPTPHPRSASELPGGAPPQHAPTKTAAQLELELARKNSEIRELQEKNLEWQQVVARTTQPSFSSGATSSSSSVPTISSLHKRENSQSQEQLEPLHNYAPEVVVESRQVRALTPWNPLEPQRRESDAAESTDSAPSDLEATKIYSILGPSVAKIAQAIEVLVESRPDAGLAILLSVTALCLTIIYVIYSIIYSHMVYFLIGFLAVIGTYSFGRYLFIIKQTEVQVKREEVQVKREEVQQEWIRSIGSKMQSQIPAGSWSQPIQGRRALMPAENIMVEELVD